METTQEGNIFWKNRSFRKGKLNEEKKKHEKYINLDLNKQKKKYQG